ncbi:Pectin lyase-like protein [Glarea lozoyensis ATCC 20868]|uniref:Pectinesterase n=1 Tax=Glarea lozoyensis (strain ATCC 20868 / MF5171) TaxID=1116229 RepID=S3CUM3_GLAL2|nr:Pectin lyase-like protein [Glarea lozoyensis ATCC 20868]EPE30112.1 Pectin lyase-like protein [Glarea lozoyensis ATCC 20868]
MRLLISVAVFLGVVSASPGLGERAACNSDNCLRAMLARPTPASEFCTTYTVAITSVALPTWASACSNLPSRISSACTCINTAAPTPGPYARVTPPSGAIIVDNSKPYSYGSYPSFQAAVLALSFTTTTPQTIFIYPGTYTEQVYIPLLKSNLTIQGWTTDARSYHANTATITFNLSRLNATNNDLTATVRNWNPNTKFYNLNIKNTFGHVNTNGQNLALSAQVTNQGYYGVQLWGYQDTVLANRGNQLYAKSLIVGAIDFIFGQYSTAWFEQVDIRTIAEGWVTASGRLDAATNAWFVINNSTVAGIDSSIPAGSNALGRPWKAFARVVFQYTYLTDVIAKEGWKPWSTVPGSENTVNSTLAEYNNTGPGSVSGGSGPRAAFGLQLDAPITPETVLGDNWKGEWYVDADYL